jgi:hypothetical protein
MFIGTRRRKTLRKEPEYLRPPSAVQHGPRVFARGDELLKKPGFVRPHFRHSALDHNLPRSAVRPFSVIPDLIRNPCSSKRGCGRPSGKNRNISGHLQPINMDPGSVIPDLIRDRGDGLLKKPGHVRPHFRHSCLFPSFLRKQESIFIGTRRRKACRKWQNTFREPSAVRHGPRIKSGVTAC